MELFKGVATALITPFRGGKIDADALDLLLDRQAAAGIPAVVMAGTTGESPALTYGEFDELLRRARERWRGTLIAGCGANCTDRAAELAKIARDTGADALLAVTPYYNKASRAGLTAHYKAICAAGLPTVVYHVPSRTGQRLSIGDFGALVGLDGICGVKECSGDLAFLRELALTFGDRWTVWTGNDDQIPAALRLGAKGVVSVISNLLPRETAAWAAACLNGDEEAERKRSADLLPKARALGREVNPIPVKYAAARMGLCRLEYRLPMTPPEPETAALLDRVFRS